MRLCRGSCDRETMDASIVQREDLRWSGIVQIWPDAMLQRYSLLTPKVS